MIPSLVVSEIRSALVEFLSSTFALTDDKARDALGEFLSNNAEGIFRGPYLRVRTPFHSVDLDSWESPLGWLPSWFVPYHHQAQAFERLSSAQGRTPEPTLVTTGTGSGKTECFLMPVLDHCARMKAANTDGIKAVILYPMNALASDQAGRIAKLINDEPHLQGLRAGIYVGDAGRYSTMGPDNIIDKREQLRADPPDILLTNYKMLDFLLLRPEDRDLWAVNGPTTLQYVILDEFHTYDGAQGTDVAMLLRRLGAALNMAMPDRPLGDATPIATSATLGSSPEAKTELREFAGKVFGADFDEESIIGESRQTAQEACETPDFSLPIPDVHDLVGLSELEDIANAFCHTEDSPAPESVVALGQRLLSHTLTHGVLDAVGDGSKSWEDTVAEVVIRAPNWGKAMMTDPHLVEAALAQFVRLLSVARRGDEDHPLFSIEVQLWIREVSRLLRTVSPEPSFRWRDSGQDEESDDDQLELPAIFCRRCGAAGWMSLFSEASHSLSANAAEIGKASLLRSPLVRSLMISHPEDPAVRWFDPSTMLIESAPAEGRVAVHMSDSEDDAKRSTCPSCGEHRSVLFLGTAVASLASVTINTIFGSTNLEERERKLLAFTDSVQDAAHRASFFGGRTHRINLRSRMSKIIQAAESISLADLGTELYKNADTPRHKFELIPPDLGRHTKINTTWSDTPDQDGIDILTKRLGFEADLEFGMRARVGRTLELSQAAVAAVKIDNFDIAIDMIVEDIDAKLAIQLDSLKVQTYVRGIAERLRLRGALMNPLLDRYVEEGGDNWWIWGGRPDGLPPFTSNQGKPTFFTTASPVGPRSEFDSVTTYSKTPSWLVNWCAKVLDIEPTNARLVNERTMAILSNETDAVVAHHRRSTTVYGLDRRAIIIQDLTADTDLDQTLLRCSMCGHLHVTQLSQYDTWLGSPCLRYRCLGVFEPSPPRQQQYYRNLYRAGSTRRVVAKEHTGLLGRTERENLETSFKAGTAPDAPNVVTATSTLEMGIDIGDLSAVMLTSVPRTPASYIQRVGRSGRLTGNSLVTTFVRSDTHSLYYLAEPESMLAGDVRSPNCYLDAVETLQRQFIAFLIDRLADETVDGPPLPRQAKKLFEKGMPENSFLAVVAAASELEPQHINAFIASFGSQIEDSTKDRLRSFAVTGTRDLLAGAISEFQQDLADYSKRIKRLAKAIDKAEDEVNSGAASAEAINDLRDLKGQHKQLGNLKRLVSEEYGLSAMGRLGLLPNYNLGDDTVNLVASLWSIDEDEKVSTEEIVLARSARLAIRELAPGNTFYVGGHRHRIDAVKIGTADAPLTEDWRICPDCDYVSRATVDSDGKESGELLSTCPRCTAHGFADNGAKFKMLRLTEAYAAASEESARVFDESDERERTQYNQVVLVDGDPTTITDAWRVTGRVFGAELLGRAHIRTLNLGHAEREGSPRHLGGQEHRVPGFTVCSHCGGVAEARDDRDGRFPERLHQGWCKVRTGATPADSEQLVLFHELTTEAIRMLLPVSMFEVDERLASFKAALLLGLREDFGGDPDHLEVVLSDAPNRQGSGRRRFLVLFDRVPGGTGYLGRLGDPERMRAILEKAQIAIARCPCVNEGRQACHRCLLGVTDRSQYELVRRDLALELLDEQLSDWTTESVESVSELELGPVEESELERRFRSALQMFASAHPEQLSFKPLPPKNPPYKSFELTFSGEDKTEVARYRIDEQEGLGTTPSVLPDFVFTRQDQPGIPVAVFCDGYEYHASPKHNAIAIDAGKRRGIRADNKFVWNLTWEDVTEFHQAVQKSPIRKVKDKPLLRGGAKKVALQAQHQQDPNGFLLDALDQNPMALLLDYLSRPDLPRWQRLVKSALAGIGGAGQIGQADAEQLPELLRGALTNKLPAKITPNKESVAFIARYVTPGDLTISAFLDIRPGKAGAERWGAIAALPDSDDVVANDSGHKGRWGDWLQWANILQFLNQHGDDIIITGVSQADDIEVEEINLVAVTSPEVIESAPTQSHTQPEGQAVAEPTPVGGDTHAINVAISPDMEEELDLLIDEEVATLVRATLKSGGPDFEAGIDLLGQPIEAAWRDAKVGVTPVGSDPATEPGWTIRTVDQWTVETLLTKIESNG